MKRLFCAFITCIASLACAYQLPSLGEDSLPPWEEAALGQQFFHYVESNATLIHDSVINEYIRSLGSTLASYSPTPDQHFYFFIVQDPAINAFAGPDGYIGVNTGLILFTHTEGELAAVMAHEISHVVEHHLARSIEAGRRYAMGSLAAMLGALFLGSPALMMGTATSSLAAGQQLSINFTRSEEQEADRMGIKILAAAGFNPNDMSEVFERMGAQFNDADQAQFEFLRTHPLFPSRIADAQNRARFYHNTHKDVNSLEYLLMKARLQALLTKDPQHFLAEATLRYQKNSSAKFKSPAITYQYALALALTHHYNEAIAQLHALIDHDPDTLLYALTLSEVQATSGKITDALRTLDALHNDYSDNETITLTYATLLLQAKKPQAAVPVLQSTLDEEQNNLGYLLLYARALGESGNLVDAYRVRAKAYLLLDKKEAATGQLTTALQLPNLTEYDKIVLHAEIDNLKKKTAD